MPGSPSATYIYAARFQPLHEGHVADIETVAQQVGEGDRLVVAVVAALGERRPTGEAGAGDENFDEDRVLWAPATALLAASDVVRSIERNDAGLDAACSIIPRPSQHWDVVSSWFPGRRVWAIPQRGESWDEEKVRFFTSRSDEVLRIPRSRTASGHELRDLFHSDEDAFLAGLPAVVRSRYARRDPL